MPSNESPAAAMLPAWGPLGEYLADAAQRTLLFWDVLRQREAQAERQHAKAVPHVLSFDAELVLDARTFDKPVNYLLVRIVPPEGVVVDPLKRPFVVVDPRAGHGPGIGGFKADSELGVALRAGHPAYFVGFTPEPMPGQTLEDIVYAEAAFLEKVIALHPGAEGKPCVIGNCQAGWAIMMVAALRPELFGPIIIPGAPLSYWAGLAGQNPMRYTGGMAGGSWMTALAGDLGRGQFDGGYLVKNFENLNPANTWWTKHYDLWSKVDTEAPRFLEFEKWWGGHVRLNAEEIQWIVDQLFVGNRLATGEIVTRRGERIDLRHIRSPIICFCSQGDNITPPQQALGWIVDLYGSDDDLRACGQTIVYAVHDSVGHLGIFVSGGVARKEHQEFASNIDLIDVLPPGLYEAVLSPATPDAHGAGRVQGEWIARFEPRTLNDVRAIVQPDAENERRFAAVRRVSEINLGLYRSFLQPWVQAAASAPAAQALQQLAMADPSAAWFSSRNPLMQPLAQWAEQVRAQRQPVSPQNPLLAWQAALSQAIVASLDSYRDLRDAGIEHLFEAVYGSPLLQAALGLAGTDEPPRRRPGIEPERAEAIRQRIAELRARMAEGGEREAVIRAIVYIGMGGPGVDERAFNELRAMRSQHRALTLQAFKQLLREQFFSLVLDRAAALGALGKMLPPDPARRQELLAMVRKIVTAPGTPTGEKAQRLAQIETLFAAGAAPKLPARRRAARKPAVAVPSRAKASLSR